MAGWAEAIPDLVLATLYVYLLLCLAFSSDPYFKRPFFIFFIATGIYSIVSVLSFLVLSQFAFNEKYWTVYFYKAAYVLNVLGASGATFGNVFIAIHRYFVLRTRDFSEKNWSNSVVLRFLLSQFIFSLARTAPVYPASYAYRNDIMKAFSVTAYVLYIIINGVCMVLIFREHLKLRGNQSFSIRLLANQRNLFIVVSVSSISYLIKALHQFVIACSQWFTLPDLYQIMFATYPIVNGLATYAAPVCLIIFSTKVRAQLLIRKPSTKAGSTIGVCVAAPST